MSRCLFIHHSEIKSIGGLDLLLRTIVMPTFEPYIVVDSLLVIDNHLLFVFFVFFCCVRLGRRERIMLQKAQKPLWYSLNAVMRDISAPSGRKRTALEGKKWVLFVTLGSSIIDH